MRKRFIHYPSMIRDVGILFCTFFLILLPITGCRTAKPETHQKALDSVLAKQTDIPTNWTESDLEQPLEAGWLTRFEDPELKAYVDHVIQHNLSLRALIHRVDAAAAVARQARAPLLPSVAASGTNQEIGTPDDSNLQSNTTEAALGISWELDIWGRLRAQRNAAVASYEAIEADLGYARLSLAAQASKLWFQATETYQQLSYAKAIVELQEKTLTIVQAKFEEGKLAKKELYLSMSDLNVAKDRLYSAKNAHMRTIRALEILAGKYPLNDHDFSQTFAIMPEKVPAGLPSELIERRPDLIAAAKRVDSAFEKVTQAKAARLPSIALTAASGYSSSDLFDLLGADGIFWSAAANFLAPIYTGGALKEQVEIESATQQAALAEFGQAALIAFSEVENALSNDVLLAEREKQLNQVWENNVAALDIAMIQFETGKLDLLSVLQMQNRVISARIAQISIRNQRLSQRVDLHLALGGSF